MGARLSSIAFAALAATLLASTAQACPSGDATKLKLASTVCFDGHYNADSTVFICDKLIESQQWFEDSIRTANLQNHLGGYSRRPVARKAVFTVISYEAPYGGIYNYLTVNADGWVGDGRVEIGGRWHSCRGCGSGRIDTEQLVQVEQRINQLTLTPQAERPKEINGKRYTVMLVQQHGVIERRDYVDVLPPDLNRFVEETNFLVKQAKDKAAIELFRRATPRK